MLCDFFNFFFLFVGYRAYCHDKSVLWPWVVGAHGRILMPCMCRDDEIINIVKRSNLVIASKTTPAPPKPSKFLVNLRKA